MWTTTETMGPSPEDRDREALLRLTEAALRCMPPVQMYSKPGTTGDQAAIAAIEALKRIEAAVEARRAGREDAEGSDDRDQ